MSSIPLPSGAPPPDPPFASSKMSPCADAIVDATATIPLKAPGAVSLALARSVMSPSTVVINVPELTTMSRRPKHQVRRLPSP